MTTKENIKAVLACYFSGFKYEIIESAANRIMEIVDNAPPITDHSRELVQKSIEIGRRVGYFEGKIENKRPHGKWIKIFENPFTNGYVCPFCGHKIQVTERFLPKVTECEVCGAKMDGGADDDK